MSRFSWQKKPPPERAPSQLTPHTIAPHVSEDQDQDPRSAALVRKPSEPPPKSYAFLGRPWRSLDWSKRREMKDALRSFKVSTPAVKYLRILVHGPVGAGKSSFINSIDSIFMERMTSGAIVATVSGHSFTKILQTHYIDTENYDFRLPFAFCDIMGLEQGQSYGVETDDLVKVLQGHIQDGFMFNPVGSCSEEDRHYNRNPKLSDRIHCLVSVVPGNYISLMEDAVIDKMKEVREEASRLRIPQVTILTKVDETCPEVAKEIKLVYKSKNIRKKMQECSNTLGVPMNCIFPVKCYHEEDQLNDEVDVLLLSALKHMLNFANDHAVVMASTTKVGGDSWFKQHAGAGAV